MKLKQYESATARSLVVFGYIFAILFLIGHTLAAIYLYAITSAHYNQFQDFYAFEGKKFALFIIPVFVIICGIFWGYLISIIADGFAIIIDNQYRELLEKIDRQYD